MALRVLGADDDQLVRRGLAALLSEADDVEVVGAVADAGAPLGAVATGRPPAGGTA